MSQSGRKELRLPERINKLQPDRTVYLRGFDSFAAAASIHSATPGGFTVSGTFRDPADFAVAVLYDADNYYEHPSVKYLPDFNFAGLTLSFTLNYSAGLQPIDSPKYNWIDWATLDGIRPDGSTAQIRLWDHATLVDAAFPAASSSFNVLAGAVAFNDQVSLWYENLAFGYTVPGGLAGSATYFYENAPYTASISVGGTTYTYNVTTPGGESGAIIAAGVAAAAAGDPLVSFTASGSSVDFTPKVNTGGVVNVSGFLLWLLTGSPAGFIAGNLCNQINGANWTAANSPHALMATVSGAQVTVTAGRYGAVNVSGTAVTWASGAYFTGITAGSPITIAGVSYTVAALNSPASLTLTTSAPPASSAAYVAPRGGYDGNMIELYSLSLTTSLTIDQPTIQLSGGSSAVSWNCSLDFTALGIDQLRQCWLTFAPALANGGAFTAAEWQATFSNWQLTGSSSVAALQVAGFGSVRIEEDDTACAYTGSWNVESGFYSKYFAKATSDATATLTVTYPCQFTHNLYLGTSLYADRAVLGVRLDGDTETPLDCRVNDSTAVVTRRLLRAGVAAGRHTVTFRVQQAGWFYFDFLETAVLADLPDALAPRANISAALDFDTDHSYKLPPARLHWIFDKLGYAGPMNEYLGVFWWNERSPSGGSFSQAQVSFSGSFAAGDTIFLTLNGSSLGKSVFAGDTPTTIASHFAAYINGGFVGAWASAAGGVLTITARSAATNYNLTVSVSATSTLGAASVTQPPQAGQLPTWTIAPSVTPPLNRAARDWHADFFALAATRGRDMTTACSMELVNPPPGFAALFPDGTPVTTATGFGSLVSQHCAIGGSAMLAYQKSVYRTIAQLQTAAGLTPSVQYGEFLWWYFAGTGGMAFYDAETAAAAQTALGRPLHVFSAPDDDPSVNAGADADFLRNRLRDYVRALIADLRSAYPAARFEVLWPYDVNYPTPLGSPPIGGQLNRAINLPVEWQLPSTSGFDTIKVEGLAFATSLRNLNLAREAIALFPGFGWPLADVRYLVAVFGVATPWLRELNLVRVAGLPVANLWAFDHICLYNLDVPEFQAQRRSFVKVS
jgi:hypothetical protein